LFPAFGRASSERSKVEVDMKTNAQIQADYRKRRDTANNGQGDRRLNTWICSEASFALKRLSEANSTTQRAIIEELILKADNNHYQSLPGTEQDNYYD